MSKTTKIPLVICAVLLIIVAGFGVSSLAQRNARALDWRGIEKLHQKDVAATLANDPKQLAELWTDDAVRLEPGPAEVGKELIAIHDLEMKHRNPAPRILTYAPEIQDIKI